MAPHAEHNGDSDRGYSNGQHSIALEGLDQPAAKPKWANRSHLRSTPANEVHDLLCIGFGPASLAIAAALHDSLEKPSTIPGLEHLQTTNPKVAFLEKQPQFHWHAGMLLHGARMQISFVKDLATLRDPRSEFTFLNYLHCNNRLVEFINLDTFLPQRLEYEDYMRWCASWFDDVVEYSQEVLQVTPEKSTRNGKVETFAVTSKNTQTGQITTRRARHVVVAAGGRAKIPKHLPQNHPKVIHSSRFAYSVSNVFPNTQAPYKAAVIGSGQSAAEIFDEIQSQYPNASTRLFIKGSALRPSDDSPFVNEIFNPSRVSDTYHQDPLLRSAALSVDRNTNYGVVRINLLERLYERLYTQRIIYNSESQWPHRILPYRSVTSIADSPVIPGGVRLYVRNDCGNYFVDGENGEEVVDVDAVFVATGYTRDAHKEILKEARDLLPDGAREENRWDVKRDYRVVFREGTVGEDAGVWLQGCCEKTHGLSDTLLSVLATRGGEMVNSIFSRGSGSGSGISQN